MPPDRGRRPRGTAEKIADVQPPVDYNAETPKFCLRHLQQNFDVHALNPEGQAAFAVALQKRATMTWRQITLAPRHGLGIEMIPVADLRPNSPAAFSGEV